MPPFFYALLSQSLVPGQLKMINVGCLWLQFISQTNDSNGDGDTDDGCIDGHDDPDYHPAGPTCTTWCSTWPLQTPSSASSRCRWRQSGDIWKRCATLPPLRLTIFVNHCHPFFLLQKHPLHPLFSKCQSRQSGDIWKRCTLRKTKWKGTVSFASMIDEE